MKRSLLVRVGCGALMVVMSLLVIASSDAPIQGHGMAVLPNLQPAPALVAPSRACYLVGVLPNAVSVGDTNRDGWLDIVVSCSGTGQVFFLQNRGQTGAPGVFSKTPAATREGSSPSAASVVVGDSGYAYLLARVFNNGAFVSQIHRVQDTRSLSESLLTSIADLVGVRDAPLERTMRTLAERVRIPTIRRSPLPKIATGIVTGNLDHNPETLDDLVILYRDNSFATLVGDILSAPYAVLTGAPVGAVIADFNQDGWNDIAIATSGDAIEVFYAVPFSGGAFALHTVPVIIPLPFTPTAINAGDFDSDGLVDLVVVGHNHDEYAAVYLNDPASPGARFAITAAGPMKTWGLGAVDIAVADFDGNGRDDFVVANRLSHNVTMFLTDGLSLGPDNRATSPRSLSAGQMATDRLDITFGLYKLELQCGYYPVSIAAADFDWNGKVDLVVALESANPEICAQTSACVEVIFDPAGGFHQSGNGGVPNQIRHPQIPGVSSAGEDPGCPGGTSGN